MKNARDYSDSPERENVARFKLRLLKPKAVESLATNTRNEQTELSTSQVGDPLAGSDMNGSKNDKLTKKMANLIYFGGQKA